MPELPITNLDMLAARIDSLTKWVNDLTGENHNLRRQRDSINEALNQALTALDESSHRILNDANTARRAIAAMGAA